MASDIDVEQMRTEIAESHGCGSTHVMPVAVHEVTEGQTVWKVVVEVFDLIGHPEAKRCYAWSGAGNKHNKAARFVTVLGIAPVVSPQTAVQAFIVRDFKKAKRPVRNQSSMSAKE
jgi:hypothetical protein